MFGNGGGIFTLVGLFASGKSSLIDGLLENASANVVVMLPTYTTRLPRNDFESSGKSKEYRFVNEVEYECQKRRSNKWNERSASGARYGIDVEEIEANAAGGIVHLATMLPHSQTLREQREVFPCPVFQVLIDVPIEVCNQRLLSRGHEVADRLRLQSSLDVDKCRKLVDSQFIPIGKSLSMDTQRFCTNFSESLKLGSA